jgi:hypothetical protein
MYDTPHLHIDTSTRLPSFFETDRRRDGQDGAPPRVKVERRAGERRTAVSLRRG